PVVEVTWRVGQLARRWREWLNLWTRHALQGRVASTSFRSGGLAAASGRAPSHRWHTGLRAGRSRALITPNRNRRRPVPQRQDHRGAVRGGTDSDRQRTREGYHGGARTPPRRGRHRPRNVGAG